MSSPFEFYFPPIFFPGVLSEKEDERLSKLIEYMKAEPCTFESSEENQCTFDSIQSSEVMMIDNKKIGKIIGQGGDVITKIRKVSGANIKIFGKFSGSKRKILITGDDFEVKIAKEKIMKRLQ